MTDKYDVEVKLLAVTPDAEKLIETAGRLCWDTQDKTGTVPDRIQKWLEIGHESMVEHACATFYIKASRVLTHELVRHRLASYSQRSQRYVKESEPRYITPPELSISTPSAGVSHIDLTQDRRAKLFSNAMEVAWDSYARLLADGV